MGLKLISIFLVIIFVLGCSAPPSNAIDECENQPNSELRDLCYNTAAITENDLGRCTQISNDEIRNSCINSFSS